MYAQLGKIIFEGLKGFNSFEQSDTTTYAQHDLVNAKPTLQAVGNDLEQLTLEIRLRAEFINPELARLQLKKSKDNFEVLPLLKGNGQYLGDYVITEMATTHEQALPDGTTYQLTLSITLLEYVTSDKLQQQQVAARKQAFAVGDKKPVAVAALQLQTVPQLASRDISAVNSYGFQVDRNISQYENNVTQQQSIADKIQNQLKKMDDRLQQFNDRIDNIPLLQNAADILSSANAVRQSISNFSFPITSLSDLQLNNRNLQQAIKSFGAGSIEILNMVITRAA